MSKKLLFGVGINDAGYRVQEKITVGYTAGGKQTQKLIWVCPFYVRWKNMLKRCYSARFQEKCQTYKGCSVCEQWLTFSKFKQWMETQDWGGKQLDKDTLFPGNTVYSPYTCVFIDALVNTFITESNASRGQCMIGVHWEERSKKFKAVCNNLKGKRKHLGYFDTEPEAHQAWLRYKQELALKLASEQTDPRVAKALIERYENYVAQEKEVDK